MALQSPRSGARVQMPPRREAPPSSQQQGSFPPLASSVPVPVPSLPGASTWPAYASPRPPANTAGHAGGDSGVSASWNDISAQMHSNMLANAARHAHPAKVQAILDSPLSPRVLQAMRAHQAATAGDPLAHTAAAASWHASPARPAAPAQLHAAGMLSPPRGSPPATASPRQHHRMASTHFTVYEQLALPLEFVQQQQQKLLAQQQAQLAAEGRTDPALSPIRATHARSSSSPGVHSARRRTPASSGGGANSHRSPTRGGGGGGGGVSSPSVPHYVPAKVPDLGYLNQKKREEGIVHLLSRAAARHADRIASAQLEMRGSLRFDTSNPQKIFDALTAQANAPLEGGGELNYNTKRVVRLKDGSYTTVFGRVLDRPDSVRAGSLSQFFVSKDDDPNRPTLERFASSNFARDEKINAREQRRAEKHNKAARHFEHKARIERTDEELLQCDDDVLSKLERWKRDQLRAKIAKQAEADAALREQANRMKEALKLRLERERFEREEREQREKELAEKAAREEEERLAREQEKLRLYREIVGQQAESNKQAKVDAEAAKLAEEEAEKARQAAVRKRMAAEGYVAGFMNALNKGAGPAIARNQAEEVVLGRMKDTEKDWKISHAKLKAEGVRLLELVRKRGKAQHVDIPAWISSSDAINQMELREELRRLRATSLLTQLEENKVKDLERLEHEARSAMDKAAAAWETIEANHAAQQASGHGHAAPAASSRQTLRRPAAGGGAHSNASSAMPSPSASNANLLSPSTPNRSLNPSMPSSPGGTLAEEGEGEGEGAADNHASRTTAARQSRRRSLKWDAALAPPSGDRRSMKSIPRSSNASRGVSQASSRVNSRHGSLTGTLDVRFAVDEPAASGHTPDERSGAVSASLTPDMSHANLAPTSGTVSGALTPSENGSATPTAAGDSVTPAAGGAGDGGAAPGDEGAAATFSNDRTAEIDKARQAMINQQQEFEARIKALTSFQGSASAGAGGGKKKSAGGGKKKSAKRGTVNAALAASTAASANSSSNAGAGQRKKQSILPVFTAPSSARDQSPDASGDDDEADERLRSSLAESTLAEETAAVSDHPAAAEPPAPVPEESAAPPKRSFWSID